MNFIFENGSLILELTDPRRIGLVRRDISDLAILQSEDLQKFQDLMKRYLVGKTFNTHIAFLEVVGKPFGRYLRSDSLLMREGRALLPNEYYGWQYLVLQFGLWYISQPTRCSLESLCRRWQKQVCPWLIFLQEEGFIPMGVFWNNMRLPEESASQGSPKMPSLLGEVPASNVDEEVKIEKVPIDKTLAGPLFWHSDAAYLDAFESRLRLCDNVLAHALKDYWVRLVRDYRTGKRMLMQTSEAMYIELENSNNWLVPKDWMLVKIGSSSNPGGFLWALRILHHLLTHSSDVTCLTVYKLNLHPGLVKDGLLFHYREKEMMEPSALLPDQYQLFTPRGIFYRYLGILNGADVAVAMAILIREHPNINPESLSGAKLLNGQNKHFLLVADDNRQIFSVDKPRAKSRKYAALSPLAAQVMRHVIRATAPVRALLKKANNPHWRYLFLGDVFQGQLGHAPWSHTELLHDQKRSVSLANLYPSLAEAGLTSGTLTFAKIRNTQGVLTWFDNGSMVAVSKRLGNSCRTAMKFYIPQSLLTAWNERIIRRFQNTLLVIASHGEEWALDVVDMPTAAELNHFLAQLVVEMPYGQSPLGDQVHEKFGVRFAIGGDTTLVASNLGHSLHVRLSPQSLSLLLGYRQWAADHLPLSAQKLPDKETGLTPKFFMDLAVMLQGAAQNADIGDKLREALDVAKLKRCYDQALELLPSMTKKLSKLSLEFDSKGEVYEH